MTAILTHNEDTLWIEPNDLHELVRGQERELVDRLTPVVQKQSVTLDLSHVERIDAAGIAALIFLYGSAQRAGKDFKVMHASHRVAEILTIVGLDRILISQNADPTPRSESCLAQSAA
jgi:anti-anti-sigma factor